jgi:hypothetical protein
MSLPEYIVRVDAAEPIAEPLAAERGAPKQSDMMRLVVLNGSFEERKAAWERMQQSLPLEASLYLLGVGAQGTVLLYVLSKLLSGTRSIVAIDERDRSDACAYVASRTGVPVRFVLA